MTLYEQVQAEKRAARIALDRIYQPLDYAVMRVDRSGPHRLRGRACAVRVQQAVPMVAPDAVLRAVEAVKQSKDRGS